VGDKNGCGWVDGVGGRVAVPVGSLSALPNHCVRNGDGEDRGGRGLKPQAWPRDWEMRDPRIIGRGLRWGLWERGKSRVQGRWRNMEPQGDW
jgi:hypothetical protein